MAKVDTTRDFLDVIVDPKEHDGDTRLDIVAVHGLNPKSSHSNAETTWTADTKDGPKFWLKDPAFLPSKIPNARILLFGYNSNPSFASSNAGLSQQAKALLLKVRYERHDCPQRPLLFICHSLGGLLVKRALVIAHGNTVDLPTFEACYGIVFFGTPHGGGNKASLGDIAFNIARVVWGKKEQNSFMEALKGNSFFAEDHRDDFLQLSNNFQFISFYEANKLKGIHQVVHREDAILNLPDTKEDKIPLDADHSQMCKFSDPDGRDYRAVWLPIKIMADNAIKQSKETMNEFFELKFSEPEHFRGRNAIIESLHRSLSLAGDSTKLYALQGPAGIGKSAIAIQYAYCFQQAYHGVFMVSAESKASLERDFQDIKMQMGLRAKKSFRQWCSESHGKPLKRWLVVIDNWEDPSVLNLREHVPRSAGGCVLVTCRRKDISQIANVIAVPPLSEKSAITLLLQVSTGRQEGARDRHYAKKIASALEFNPLAIKQCGQFVQETESDLAQYPSSLDELMAKIQPALGDSYDDIFRYDREEKSILTTWEVSFQHLEKHDQEASEILSLFGFLEPSSVQESIIAAGLKTQRRWASDGSVADTWLECTPSGILPMAKTCESRGVQKILQKLSNYSFLFETPKKGRYYMNGLTHYWLSHRQRDSRASSLQNAVYLLANGYPHPDFAIKYGWNLQTQAQFLSYKPHLRQMQKTYEDGDVELDQGTLHALAIIFLYDRELRIRFANRRGDFLWQDDEDHASYFELVESIVRRSHSPSLWLHAMVAYFDLHLGIQMIAGRDMHVFLAEYEYAGTNWLKVNEALRSRDPVAPPKHEISQDTNVGIPQDQAQGDTLSWTGVVVDSDILNPIDPSSSSDSTIGLCNGYMGLFVILLIRSWRQNLGKRMHYKVLDQRSAFIENRDGISLIAAWLESEYLTNPILKYVSSLLNDFLVEIWRKTLVAAFKDWEENVPHDKQTASTIGVSQDTEGGNSIKQGQPATATGEQQDIKRDDIIEKINIYLSSVVSIINHLISYLGVENLITMQKIDYYLAICSQLGLNNSLAELWRHPLQEIPLTSQNVFSITCLLGYLIRGDQDWIGPTMEDWVQKITDLDRTANIPHDYTNDPLLDVLELTIRFYQKPGGDQEKLASWKQIYHAAALQRYPNLTSQLCLGFGIGAFGLPGGRLRTHDYLVGEDPWDMPRAAENTPQVNEQSLTNMQRIVAETKALYQKYIDEAWTLPTNKGISMAMARLLSHFQRSLGVLGDDTPEYWTLTMGATEYGAAEERDAASEDNTVEEGDTTVVRENAGVQVLNGEQSTMEAQTKEQQALFGREAFGVFVRRSNITIGELATIISRMPVSDDAAPGIHLSSDDESASESESDEGNDEEPLSANVLGLPSDESLPAS